MPAPTFLTVPRELQSSVYACWDALQGSGYRLFAEHSEPHFPETATILARRPREHRFYLFDARIKEQRLILWSKYGRSCSSATFIISCVPVGVAIPAATIPRIQELGIGLTIIDEDGSLREVLPPIDLSLNISLPPLDRHKAIVRRELFKAHREFDRGDWKRGFELACKTVERFARNYLLREARAGKVQVPGKGGLPKAVSPREIDRMPLGALAEIFCQKLIPSQVDAQLCGGLKKINPDRIDVAHDKMNASKERRLRANVARHMWTIDNLLTRIPV
jgi:hypothetical protein